MPREDDAPARDAAEAVARRSYGKLVAYLAARTRDVAGAEDALGRGVRGGARRLARDAASPSVRKPGSHRGAPAHDRRRAAPANRARRCRAPPPHGRRARRDGGRRRRHPRRPPAADVRLRASGDRRRGPRAADPARPCSASMPRRSRRRFLVAPATMGQRLVRAKTKITQAGIPFRVPRARSCASVWRRCWKRSTPRLRRAGTIPAARSSGVATSPPRRSGSDASWWRSCRTGRGARPLGAHAPRRGPPPGAPLRHRRLRAARRAGPDDVGRARHRGGGRAPAARRHVRRDRALSIGGGRAVGARRAALHGSLGLAGDRPALRRSWS